MLGKSRGGAGGLMRVQKPRLKIQMLFRATGGRSRRTRNGSFARGNVCLLRCRRRRVRHGISISAHPRSLSLFPSRRSDAQLRVAEYAASCVSFIIVVITLTIPVVQLYTCPTSARRAFSERAIFASARSLRPREILLRLGYDHLGAFPREFPRAARYFL